MFRRYALFLIAACAIALAAKPDFSGTWKLDKQQSDFGPLPAPEVFERKIVHHDPTIEITTTQSTPKGVITTTAKHTTNGKESVNSVQGGDVKSTLAWQGDKLVINSSLKIQGADVKSKETWWLSENGKQLFVESEINTPNGDFKIKLVLDRA